MINTRKGNPERPTKVMIYGPEGVGKNTFAAGAPKTIFGSLEGGCDFITGPDGRPVDMLLDSKGDDINTWKDFAKGIHQLVVEKHDFKTLVIDTADALELLGHKKIIGSQQRSITTVNGGYGAGYRESQSMHQNLLSYLDILMRKKSMNIVICAHTHVKEVRDPEMPNDYDAYEIKCHEMVSALWRQWVDDLFFARFRTFVKTNKDTDKTRAIGDGSRVIYTTKTPSFQAKNRHEMPSEMEFTKDFWNTYAGYLGSKTPAEKVNKILKEAQKETISETVNTIDSVTNDILALHKILKEEGTRKQVDDYMNENGKDLKKLIKLRKRLRTVTGEVE